jgi:uncharacterized membrane protein
MLDQPDQTRHPIIEMVVSFILASVIVTFPILTLLLIEHSPVGY